MKRKLTLLVLVAALACQVINAQDVFTTKGDGTTYNIKTLTEIPETGIEPLPKDDGVAAMPKYGLTKSITITEGDKFIMDIKTFTLLLKERETSAKHGQYSVYMTRMSKQQPRFA